MTQSFLAASFNVEENKRLTLIQYVCFLSSHEVLLKTDKGKKGGVPSKKHLDYLFYFDLFKGFILLRLVRCFARLHF